MTPLTLHTLRSAEGSRHRRRRVGRGNGSRGTYSGRGSKGQRSRTGGRRGIIRRSLRMLLERVPKQRGFRSLANRHVAVINLGQLEKKFSANEMVTPQTALERGLVETISDGVKILGNGSVSKPLQVRVNAISASARIAIEKAGGSITMLKPKNVPAQTTATKKKE